VTHPHRGGAVAGGHGGERPVDRAASSSRSFTVPMTARIGSSTSLFLRMVFADRPGSPPAIQSSAAFRTV
jgi:hypothetical protein